MTIFRIKTKSMQARLELAISGFGDQRRIHLATAPSRAFRKNRYELLNEEMTVRYMDILHADLSIYEAGSL